MGGLITRESRPGDWPAIEALYPAAVPDEDLLPLVGDLLREASGVLSIVGMVGSALVGHAVFTGCTVTGSDRKTALLGPLAVLPRWQRQGAGSGVVAAGLTRLEEDGVTRVFVLGDPAFYRRFGFVHEALVDPPYRLPAAWRFAWQSLSFGGAVPTAPGRLEVPPAWLQPSRWAP